MAGQAQLTIDDKVWQVAWNFVNVHPGNKSAALRRYFEDNGIDFKSNRVNMQAYDFFRNHAEELNPLIDKFRAENRAAYPQIRDENITRLREIASTGGNKDSVTAIKTLNDMLGYNSTNVNLNGKIDSEVILDITNL